MADIGTQGKSRAGAWVAAPDDLLAIHYNPSGLSLMKGFHLETSVEMVAFQGKFERSCPCVPGDSPDRMEHDAALQKIFDENPAETNKPVFIPFLGAAYGFDFLDLTVGLALWGPTGGRLKYGELPRTTNPRFDTEAEKQPGRYNGLDMDEIEANVALGLSLSPFKGFRIGATAVLFQAGSDQTVHLWANLPTFAGNPPRPENPGLDIPVVFSFKENAGLNWAVGAGYDIPEISMLPGRLSLGASFRGKRDIRTAGQVSAQIPQSLAEIADVQGDEVTVEASVAPLFRAGIQYDLPDLFELEVAFVWEGWSANDLIVIRPNNVTFAVQGQDPIDLPKFEIERRWKDTWALRVGGEFKVFEPELGIGLGYFYEPSGIPAERLEPSRIDLDKHGVGLGLSTTFAGFRLELSGMYVAMSSLTVSNSKVDISAPELNGSNPNFVTITGNGRYSGRYFISSLSLSVVLDDLMASL